MGGLSSFNLTSSSGGDGAVLDLARFVAMNNRPIEPPSPPSQSPRPYFSPFCESFKLLGHLRL